MKWNSIGKSTSYYMDNHFIFRMWSQDYGQYFYAVSSFQDQDMRHLFEHTHIYTLAKDFTIQDLERMLSKNKIMWDWDMHGWEIVTCSVVLTDPVNFNEYMNRLNISMSSSVAGTDDTGPR